MKAEQEITQLDGTVADLKARRLELEAKARDEAAAAAKREAAIKAANQKAQKELDAIVKGIAKFPGVKTAIPCPHCVATRYAPQVTAYCQEYNYAVPFAVGGLLPLLRKAKDGLLVCPVNQNHRFREV
ncbi:MAG: hypothetical protein EHM28_01035 [Spirochaetaceae bacterium]|nr:MAG: hypothetical protein EHM28_01035 [Spirochaetaceae bacterium]